MNDYFINLPNNSLPANNTTGILGESNAIGYHRSLPGYRPTPLVALPNLASKYGVANIYIKDESHRLGLNAFKGLGASFAIHKLLEQQPGIATFCTATDGNHGRAVAWAAKITHKKAVVFVPQGTAPARIRAIESEGAKVIMVNGNYDETCAVAASTSNEQHWQLVQDTAWENYEEVPAWIMAGYITHFQEMEDSVHQLPIPAIDIVFLQAGVGSWAAAAVWYYLNRYGNDRPKIVIVEPSEAAGILASFTAGERVNPQGSFETIMAGLNCGIPSLTAWDIIKNGADVSIKIKDNYAEQGIRELYYPDKDDERIIAGESGVGGFAGFIALMTRDDMKILREKLHISSTSNILFYNTEGATDIDNFNKIIKLL